MASMQRRAPTATGQECVSLSLEQKKVREQDKIMIKRMIERVLALTSEENVERSDFQVLDRELTLALRENQNTIKEIVAHRKTEVKELMKSPESGKELPYLGRRAKTGVPGNRRASPQMPKRNLNELSAKPPQSQRVFEREKPVNMDRSRVDKEERKARQIEELRRSREASREKISFSASGQIEKDGQERNGQQNADDEVDEDVEEEGENGEQGDDEEGEQEYDDEEFEVEEYEDEDFEQEEEM